MPSPTTRCPDAKSLATYVSGSLDEGSAARLLEHLDHCENCRQLVDEMAQRADSLVSALRHPTGSTAPDAAGELGRLIRKAQQFDPAAANSVSLPPPSRRNVPVPEEPVALDQFVECLSKSGLMQSSEVELLVEEIAPTSTLTFARELIARQRLTPLQARALALGKWRGLILGDYVVLEKLGQGGMGQVFKARHKQSQNIVCLKVLQAAGRSSPQHLERFRREAKMIAALDHPNIVVAHSAAESDCVPYLVMEFVDGCDLAKQVRDHGPLDRETAVNYVLQAARALAYAHSRGVIHRDIKPHNLMLDAAGNIKVLDMGLARFDLAASELSSCDTVTQTGTVMGTVDYIAPEQALNAKEADYRADIYSLGCTLHFLLTGHVPFAGETVMERLVAHREQPIPRLAAAREGISNELEAVFRRMLAKDPAERYQSMTELVRDLESLLKGTKPAASLHPPTGPVIYQLEAVPEDNPTSSLDLETLPALDDQTLPLVPSLPKPVRVHPKRTRHGSKTRNLAAATTLLAVAAIVLLGFVARSLLSSPHPASLAAGGPGRAMIVVAHKGFSQRDYNSLTSALDRRGIEYVTASTTSTPATSNKQRPLPIDLTLGKADPRSFDALFVCGGNSSSLQPQAAFFANSLNQGTAVAAIGDGFHALGKIWPQSNEKWDEVKSGFDVKKSRRSYLIKICTKDAADSAVEHLFAKLSRH